MTDPSSSVGSGFTSSRLTRPLARLVLGLTLAVAIIAGFTAYTVRDIRRLRDEQATLSERNRLDGIQIVRIQQNLSTVAAALRDMLAHTEPYPLTAWANTFARLRLDLQVLDLGGNLASPTVTPMSLTQARVQMALASEAPRGWIGQSSRRR